MSFLLYLNRKDFRPACGKLGLLSNIFFKTPSVGLTATATKLTQRKIEESLGLIKPRVVEKIEASLPIYSHRNANAIWGIIQKYIWGFFWLHVWFKKISYPPHGMLIIIHLDILRGGVSV